METVELSRNFGAIVSHCSNCSKTMGIKERLTPQPKATSLPVLVSRYECLPIAQGGARDKVVFFQVVISTLVNGLGYNRDRTTWSKISTHLSSAIEFLSPLIELSEARCRKAAAASATFAHWIPIEVILSLTSCGITNVSMNL